jgi:hypothetical protein
MKRRIIPTLVSVVLLMSGGCKDTFSPKAEVKQEYVLQCFVEGQPGRIPSTVNALLARTYDVDGFDPSVNTIDPSIAGAKLTFFVNSTSYSMQDSLRFNPDSARYGSKQRYYFSRVTAPSPADIISIVAKLPDGTTLNAQTTLPQSRAITSSIDFPQGVTTMKGIPSGVKSWLIDWENADVTESHLFFPRLTILYSQTVNGGEVLGTIIVPMKYVAGPNGSEPAYPSYTTDTHCEFDLAAIDSAMAHISAGDPQKGNYGVHTAWFELIEYDLPLSKYYSSVNGSLDQFSIRVDQLVYSNIGGGIGILGSYFRDRAQFFMDLTYVKSFGYQYR